jgi:undecaprenyl-diphosphatase
MNIIQSIILGFVQGLTEFLPVSSTAHLALVPWFFRWSDPGLAFDVALHIGTLAAVIYYFWRDFVVIIKEFIQGIFARSFENYPNGRLGFFIIIATIPGALFGFLFEKQAEEAFRNPIIIALSILIFGIILYIADRFSRKRKEISDMNLLDSLVIGISQALAIIPGVSRSGITIIGGLARDLKRDTAARFSFLISTPLIAGAAILESRHLNHMSVTSLPIAAGVLTSAIFGFLAIKYLLRYVQTRSYTVFVIYRILIAAVILFVYMHRVSG